MTKPNIILLFTIFCCLFVSCRKDKDTCYEQFLKDDTIRMEESGSVVFKFEPNTCQESYNRLDNSFCVGTDTMSDFFSVKFNTLPSGSGQILSGSLLWTTKLSIRKKENVAFEVVKLEGDKVWLWNTTSSIGIVVRFLF